MFDAALNPDTEKGQYTPSTTELTSDAFLMLLGGTDTTAAALTVAVFGALRNPHVMNKLRAELRGVMPTATTKADWASLEKLPYLVSRIRDTMPLSDNNNRIKARYHQRKHPHVLRCTRPLT